MTITTRFDIGQEVFFIFHTEVYCEYIIGVSTRSIKDKTLVYYQLQHPYSGDVPCTRDEHAVYETEEAAWAALESALYDREQQELSRQDAERARKEQ